MPNQVLAFLDAERRAACRRGGSFQEFFVREMLDEVAQDILGQSFRLSFPFFRDGHEVVPDPLAYLQFRHCPFLLLLP